MQVSMHLGKVDFNKTNIASGFKVFSWPELLPDVMTKHIWSGIIWKNGYRTSENFISADWCVLDFDDPHTSLSEITRSVCDMRHIIGTTKSHQKEKKGVICDRFRLVMPFSRTITNPDEYVQNMQEWIRKWGCDYQCQDAARYFFPCQEIIDVDMDPDLYAVHVNDYVPPKPRPPSRAHELHHISRFAKAVCTYGAPPGVRNEFAHRCYRDLRESGFEQDVAEGMAFAKIIGLSSRETKSIVKSVEKYLLKKSSQ